MRSKNTSSKEKGLFRSSNRYVKLNLLGEGTYGQVFKAKDLVLKKICAVKIINLLEDNEGVPPTAIREISILRELHHPNIVKMYDVFYTLEYIFLVFEYVELVKEKIDMKKLLDKLLERNVKNFHISMIKKLMFDMLQAVEFCHSKKVVHRDLKPSNILINEKYDIKVCDFGLARVFASKKPYTHEVITLWYRPPEILLGDDDYTTTADIWSLGCIFYEILTFKPLWTGDSEIDQLFKIFRTLGTPNEENWDGVTLLPGYQAIFPKWEGNKIGYKVKGKVDEFGCDLLEKMLVLDPKKRISAIEALMHPFFKEYVDKIISFRKNIDNDEYEKDEIVIDDDDDNNNEVIFNE